MTDRTDHYAADQAEDDATQVVYVVAHENGDDMCGGLNLHGIYTSEDAAQSRLNEVVSEGFLGVAVYLVPLNIPGWLGYGSNPYDRYAADEERQREEELEDAWQARDWETVRRLQDEAEQQEDAPDPLDENDHRDRLDRDGDVVRRKPNGYWTWATPGFDERNGRKLSSINATDGPLTFAPDAAPDAP